ncbi:MAG: LysM peptidoglycan-binding domain-containing M23 family metallopeptidase [Geminicoccaceae bacterium]|nr:LysM peptidoglycan-binding domain-containing M23 family metallopeptidase [Geminicoccaceae bacterium]
MMKTCAITLLRLWSAGVLAITAGCSDYQNFEWNDQIGWEASRMRAQDDAIRSMTVSLQQRGEKQGVAAAPGPPGVRPQSDNRHVVMPGDTAIGIARAYGLSLSDFASINRLDIPYPVYVGQVVLTRPIPAGKQLHTVRRGETFSSIARSYARRLDELRAMNPDLDVNRIRVGQKVRITTGTAMASSAAPVSPFDVEPAAAPRRNATTTPGMTADRRESETQRTQRLLASAPVPDLSRDGFIWPVEGVVVTRFGARGNGQRSDGIDIQATRGSTVRSVESGIVVYSGDDIPSMGRMLMIRHADGFLSAYAHNDALLVRTGDRVRRGQPVAKVGTSGGVNSPRLHFELRKGTTPLNPLSHLPKNGTRVASAE